MDNDSNLNNNENYTNKPFYQENTNNPLGQVDPNIQNMNTNSENPYGQSNVVDNTGMYGQKNEGNQYNNNPDISGNKVYSVPTNSPVPESNSNLGIVSFILTILGCTALIGLILAIVDLTTKDGKKKTFSKISIGICAVWVLIFTINRVTTHNRHKKGSDYVVTTEATTELTTEATTEVTTERTTSATTEVTTEALPEDTREDKNGWNPDTNVSHSLDIYTFDFPEYFNLEETQDDKGNTNLVAKLENNKTYYRLFIYKSEEDIDSDDIKIDDINKVFDQATEQYKSSKEISKNNWQLTDSNDIKYFSRNYLIESDEGELYYSLYLAIDVQNNNAIAEELLSRADSTYNYDSDIDKIISSVRLTDSSGDSTEKSTGSSDVREMLDAYEAFMNEYFDLLEKMAADPTDLNLIAEYGDLLQKEAEWTKKIDAMDEDEMSPEDAAYYLEVTGRIYKRLAEFGEN